MEYTTYRNNVTDPVQPTDPEVLYEIERHTLHVSSQFRDRAVYPDSGAFKVTLPGGGFKDVVAVELIGGTLPNRPGLTNSPYLLLDLGARMNQVKTLDGNTYFAVINVFNHISGSTYLTVDRSLTEGKPSLFKPVRESLLELDVRILYADGTQVLFGDEPVDQLMDFQKQVSLIFNIHTRVRKPLACSGTRVP
ncbi:hypothetical protein HDV00_012772 [Rhizophlyctis rosea]|nr:hypothetical protein HDV00_012772 [Rhizophlyctis rosea]